MGKDELAAKGVRTSSAWTRSVTFGGQGYDSLASRLPARDRHRRRVLDRLGLHVRYHPQPTIRPLQASRHHGEGGTASQVGHVRDVRPPTTDRAHMTVVCTGTPRSGFEGGSENFESLDDSPKQFTASTLRARGCLGWTARQRAVPGCLGPLPWPLGRAEIREPARCGGRAE